MPCEVVCLASVWWVQSSFQEAQFVVAGETGINVPPLQSLSLTLHRVLVGLLSQVTDEQLCSLCENNFSLPCYCRNCDFSMKTEDVSTYISLGLGQARYARYREDGLTCNSKDGLAVSPRLILLPSNLRDEEHGLLACERGVWVRLDDEFDSGQRQLGTAYDCSPAHTHPGCRRLLLPLRLRRLLLSCTHVLSTHAHDSAVLLMMCLSVRCELCEASIPVRAQRSGNTPRGGGVIEEGASLNVFRLAMSSLRNVVRLVGRCARAHRRLCTVQVRKKSKRRLRNCVFLSTNRERWWG